LAIKRKEANMFGNIQTLFTLLVLASLSAFVTGCSNRKSGPSEVQVVNDWNAFWSKDNSAWMKDVQIKKVEVADRSINGNVAEVIVKITGDWLGGSGLPTRPWGWEGGAAVGFKPSAGPNQTVEWKFIYKKFDTGWRLEDEDPVH
jgi:hypothetical protein